MSPLWAAALGSLLRWALAGGAGLLVGRGIWTEAEATTYLTAGVAGVLALLWSVWNKYGGRLKLLTALAAPVGTTEQQVERLVDAGQAPPVNTPKDVSPPPLTPVRERIGNMVQADAEDEQTPPPPPPPPPARENPGRVRTPVRPFHEPRP